MTPELIDTIARRMLQDILSQAEAGYWARRAEDFEKARPTPEALDSARTARITVSPVVDWSVGWPTRCTNASCSLPPRECRHQRVVVEVAEVVGRHGPTYEELTARDRRLAEQARACRNRAEVITSHGDGAEWGELLDHELGEVA